MEKDDSIHQIDTELKLQALLKIIEDGEEITGKFLFETEELRSMFLSEMIPQGVDFEDKYYYFDKERNLHIAESEEGFLWVSTIGLVPTEKYSDNIYVNAFVTQKEVMLALLESAERLLSTEAVYDIDSFENGQIRIFSPAIWSNFVFLIELTCKAYLSISGKTVNKTHRIVDIVEEVKKALYSQCQNDTIFHAYFVLEMETLSEQIKKIPGAFNEAYIKYDANEQDNTCISFSKEAIKQIRNSVLFYGDFISNYYYSKENPSYLRPGLYERLIQKAPDGNAKEAVKDVYSFLISTQEDTPNADT